MGHIDISKDGSDRHSLSSQVFNQIRDDILNGRYKKNEELKETAIGKELGVSRTPVREALRQLELEGLVHIIPNRGAYVTGITSKDARDIYMIRSRLEGLCASWAAVSITDHQIEQLEENIYLSKFHMEKEHYNQLLELDNQFHGILYESSNSKILEHLLRDFHDYIKRVRKESISDEDRAQDSIAEHARLVEALKEHNQEEAEQLATVHIMNTIRNIGLHHHLEDILEDDEVK